MIVNINRNTDKSKDIEMQLKLQYTIIYGKTGSRSINVDSAESDSDDS